MKRYDIVLLQPTLRRLERKAARCRDARLVLRYRIVILSARGWDRPRIIEALGCNAATVSKVRCRWVKDGEALRVPVDGDVVHSGAFAGEG